MTISPSPIAEVCYVGDRLLVICNVSDNFLRWRFNYTFENGTTDQSFSEMITAGTTRASLRSMSNPKTDVLLTITRVSELGATPLIATAEFSAVSMTMNRTVITCLDFYRMSMAMTTVNIMARSSKLWHFSSESIFIVVSTI